MQNSKKQGLLLNITECLKFGKIFHNIGLELIFVLKMFSFNIASLTLYGNIEFKFCHVLIRRECQESASFKTNGKIQTVKALQS